MPDTTPTPPPVVTEGDREAANELVDRLNDCIVSDYDHDGESHELSWAAVDMLAAAIAQAREEGAEETELLDFLLAHQGEFHMSGRPETGYRVMDCRRGLSFYTDKFDAPRKALRAAIDAFRMEERGWQRDVN